MSFAVCEREKRERKEGRNGTSENIVAAERRE